MALKFPNPSRSYDPGKRRVCFWGHDTTIEVTFFLDEGALTKLEPDTRSSEESILASFDKARDRILSIATKLYVASGRRVGGVIMAEDF